MKQFYILAFFILSFLQTGIAQDPTPGVFIGPPEFVRCGNTTTTSALVYYKFRADSYSVARETAASLLWRFENLYANSPSYLREFYRCKSAVCENDPPCWANAEIINVQAISLVEFTTGGYSLHFNVNYKVECLDCN